MNWLATADIGPCPATEKLKEIAMLMPILTARTPAHAAHSVPVEAILPRDRLQVLVLSISGARADAILKILETLGRHLNGSEVLPKEALVKLMETLARILKFPPLPQETTHEFGQRLASFLEKLPPEARIVLEKQLGQRNLALQVRVLAEVLNNPATADAGRLHSAVQNSALFGSALRTETAQQSRSPLPQPALPAQHLATLTAGSAPVMIDAPTEAAFLQAVLRKTFGSEDEKAVAQPATDDGEVDTENATKPKRPGETGTKTQLATPTSNLSTARPIATSEAMPLLRAAAAFLAADPEALSLVSAIAQGEIDPQVEIAFAPQSDAETQSEPAKGNIPIDAEIETALSSGKEVLVTTAQQSEPVETPADEPLPAGFDGDEQPIAKQETLQERAPSLPRADEAQIKPDNDRLEMEDLPADKPSETQTDEQQSPKSERQQDKPVRILAETLKALVQNTLPLPESDIWSTATPYNRTTAENSALVASLQSGEVSGLEAMLDAAAAESDAGWTAELFNEIDSWVAQADAGQDDAPEIHSAWAQQPKTDETIRDPLMQSRLMETVIGRDAIPFAIIPYLPAKTEDDLPAEQTDEQQASSDEDETGEETKGEDRPDRQDEKQAASRQDPDTDTGSGDMAQDAYGLYMRMGGLA